MIIITEEMGKKNVSGHSWDKDSKKVHTILVVDDDMSVRQTFELLFPEYEVIGTSSVFEALDLIRIPGRVSLVILDVVMPGVNGLQILKQLRKLDADIPVVVCTAYGSKDVIVQSLRNGATDYIEKPFDVEEMTALLRRYIEDEETEDTVHRIYSYLETNYDRKISLDDVSRRFGVSYKYISRAFRERFGKTFSEIKISLRMEKARDLLINTKMSIQEVASCVGYKCYEAFSRTFYNWHGVWPADYRVIFQMKVSAKSEEGADDKNYESS